MTDWIFDNSKRKELEKFIYDSLQQYNFELSADALNSPRTIGDNVEKAISNEFGTIIEKTDIKISNFVANHSRRGMADFSFISGGFNYVVDVKTHRTDAKFSMPNLISVKRLADFYQEEDKNYFVLFLISYKIKDNAIEFEKVSICPIEHLSWNCLTLGALGEGQIQIANGRNVNIVPCSKKDWMLELCNKLIDSFYPKEKNKIDKRIEAFKVVRNFWLKK